MKSFGRFARFRVGIFGLGILGGAGALTAQPVSTVGELLSHILPNTGNPNYFVIPVAGHVDGFNGTEFRTDVTILAAGGTSARIAVAWLAEGVDNTAQPLDFFEQGSTAVFYPDMVASPLGKTGLGALVVAAIGPDGSIDASARLSGFARIWSQAPGCTGTASIAVPGSAFSGFVRAATGLLLDSGHRGTIGIVNPYAQSKTYIATYSYPLTEISVPPASMLQVPNPGASEVLVYPKDSATFAGYATSVDQLSGDGWYVSFNK